MAFHETDPNPSSSPEQPIRYGIKTGCFGFLAALIAFVAGAIAVAAFIYFDLVLGDPHESGGDGWLLTATTFEVLAVFLGTIFMLYGLLARWMPVGDHKDVRIHGRKVRLVLVGMSGAALVIGRLVALYHSHWATLMHWAWVVFGLLMVLYAWVSLRERAERS